MGTFRIIAGKWRGRRLHFPDVAELRPTGDRTRETLFNWLSPMITDSHCLDGFAGSGALGLEALSRGCAHVTFVEKQQRLTHTLQQHVATLDCANKVSMSTTTFAQYLRRLSIKTRFNIVFLDPPFYQDAISECITLLEQADCLAPVAYVYIEVEKTVDIAKILPKHWKIYRQQLAGQVTYYLLEVTASGSVPSANKSK